MAAAHAHRDLRKGIQSRSFERAYYFYGDDDYLKDEMIRQITDAAVDPATRDFNSTCGVAAKSMRSRCCRFSRRRRCWPSAGSWCVRDVQALKKDARAALDRYLVAPGAGRAWYSSSRQRVRKRMPRCPPNRRGGGVRAARR